MSQIIWEDEEHMFRIVKNDHIHFEHYDGEDSMGNPRWYSVDSLNDFRESISQFIEEHIELINGTQDTRSVGDIRE